MMHAHQRTDRDQHIEVMWDNIPEPNRRNFEVIQFNTFGAPYDCDSVMHYAKDQMGYPGRDTMGNFLC